MSPTLFYRLIVFLHLLFSFSNIVGGDCECGYLVHSAHDDKNDSLLFTDSIQTDFRIVQNMTDLEDWQIEHTYIPYTKTSHWYGRIVEDKNIVPSPLENISSASDGPLGQDSDTHAGLQLIVRKGVNKEKCVSFGQIQSIREDIRYGSFRAYMKTSPITGTCAASFFYYNDSQEIDIEILSKEQNSTSHLINLSLQSEAAIQNGFDAQDTPGFLRPQLDYNPSDRFHEYRYDWTSEVVSFFEDDIWIGDLNFSIPTEAGRVQLSHWSNGNPHWTAGPPKKDATITIAYFMGYFNSTNTTRMQEYENTCANSYGSSRICQV